ncbi:hypothetical protein BDW62DRAFT_202962 [Aspergillus aurantiobrunneus]
MPSALALAFRLLPQIKVTAIVSDCGDAIPSQVPDSGRYTWTPPDDVADLHNYTICLYPDQPPQDFECLPDFAIAGAGTTTSQTPSPLSLPTPSTTNSQPASSGDPSPYAPSDGPSTAAKAGIGIGVALGVVIMVFAGFCWGRRRREHEAVDDPILLVSQPTKHMERERKSDHNEAGPLWGEYKCNCTIRA